MDNKRQKMLLRSDAKIHKSFESRICDDLCEVIVSYLSFEDKIRLESVSKQFQRCVCVKHYFLDINKRFKTENTINYDFSVNLIALKSVLKKYKFIKEVIISRFVINTNSTLKVIDKYCNHLKTIELNFNRLTDKIDLILRQKFRKKLIEIRNNTEIRDGIDIKTLLFGENLRLKILFPNLTNVNIICFFQDLNLNVMKKFTDIYKKRITSLTFRPIFTFNSFQYISQFENLKTLKLFFDEIFSVTEIFFDYFKRIGSECKLINDLEIKWNGFDNSDKDIFKILFKTNTFSQLKKLKLSSYVKRSFGFELLKVCKQLTHLELKEIELSDESFKNIDQYLSQLKHLKIDSFYVILSDNSLHSLSKIKTLKTLSIKIPSNELISITDNGMIAIINNCSQIESILMKYRTYGITNETMTALISLAEKKPRICFRHEFHDKSIVLLNDNILPNNLKLILK